MAGFDFQRGKSNNAVQAEKEGLFPASKIASKLGIPTAFIKKKCKYAEQHHTSGKFFRLTEFYSLEKVKKLISTQEGETLFEQYREESKEARKISRAQKPETFENCDVGWREWKTKKRPVEFKVQAMMVTIKGQKATFTLSDGEVKRFFLRKKGFWFANDQVELHAEGAILMPKE